MLSYIKKRYAASVNARSETVMAKLEARIRAGELGGGGVGSWDGTGDPFLHHRQAVIAALSEGVAAVYGYDVQGDIAEFGTMSGHTATGLARAIATCDSYLGYASKVFENPARELLLFDSFTGLPSLPTESVDGQSPHVQRGVWSAGSLVGVGTGELSGMVRAHLPFERFHIYAGWFSETVPALDPSRRFALLHIDSDLYQSAIDVLDSLLSRGMVSRGAYIYFDDWNCNGADPEVGERRAWSECVEKYQIKFSEMGTYGIYALRLVIHDYAGSPARRPASAAAQATNVAEVGEALAPAIAAETTAYVPSTDSSTDVYDHQTASQHYDKSAGLSDMDPPFLPIYDRCRYYSMTSPQRLYGVYKAVEYLQQANVEGAFVECGVWRGGSMMVAAETLRLLGGRERDFYLFDTFEGLPEPTSEDVDVWGHEAKSWWSEKKLSDSSSDWARSHLSEVQANMAQTGYQADRIHCVKGLVEDTLPEAAPEKIALLRLDTDWYTSTKHEMEHLFPRLARNGVLIIDDYGHFKGAKQAVDEYLAEHNEPLMLVRVDYTGRIAIRTHGGV